MSRPTARRAPRLVIALLALAGAPLPAQVIAITGGTVHPVSGPALERATVLIRDGRIVAVGADVAVPAGARRIDATGKVVTPGLVHASTALGLGVGRALAQEDDEEYAAIGGTTDDNRTGDVNAAFNPLAAIDPDAVAIPIAAVGGVTTAVVMPTRGLVAGQAVAIDLAGTTLEAMTASARLAMVADLSDATRGTGGGSRAGALQRLRTLLDDARVYRQRRAEYERAGLRELAAPAADLEAFWPVLDGQLPLYVRANRKADIENVLRLARDYRLRVVLRGGAEAWKVAGALAAARVPVVLDPRDNLPNFDGLGSRYDNATLLREAGVPVIIAGNDPGGQASVRYEAGHAVRNGMAWDDALAAITLEPARAFGLAARYGSLEPGKVANLVVWSGDPLDFAARAEVVLVRGREVPRANRHLELLERYRTLPPAY